MLTWLRPRPPHERLEYPSRLTDSVAATKARFDFVELLVGDVPGARNHLVERLRFPVTDERPGDFVEPRLGRTRLCVDRAGKDPHAGDTRAIVAFTVNRVDETADWLKAQGVPFDRVHGQHGDSLRVALGPGLEITFNSRE